MNPLLATILASLKSALEALLAILPSLRKPAPTPPPEPVPEPVPVPIPPPAPIAKYDWSTPAAARHSVRVICDEEGLTLEQKNTMTATVGAESEYRTDAVRRNYVNGKVWSTDWGICQWNDYYHGKEISPDEAVNNPEKAVRLMAKYWKMGETHRRWWIAYKNGRYKAYL